MVLLTRNLLLKENRSPILAPYSNLNVRQPVAAVLKQRCVTITQLHSWQAEGTRELPMTYSAPLELNFAIKTSFSAVAAKLIREKKSEWLIVFNAFIMCIHEQPQPGCTLVTIMKGCAFSSFLDGQVKVCVKASVPQSCLTLCNLKDCSLPGSSVLWILQARILEWVPIPFSKGNLPTRGSNPGLWHCR